MPTSTQYSREPITLPVNNGGDEQFDADFEDTMTFVKAVVGRRKEARANAMEARRAETGTGSVEDDSAARQGLPETSLGGSNDR